MTQPYYATPNYFWVREDSPIQTPASSGKEVGSCASCSYEAFLTRELVIPGVELEFEVEDPEIVTFDLEPPGLQAVADGEIDAFLASEPIGQQAVDDGLPLRKLEKPAFTFYPSGFVDRSSGLDPVGFLDKVNEIIRARQADGTMRDLSVRFLGKDYATGGAEFDLDSIGQQVP
jgi:ABC-type amino acid transport substrate-binding protein